METWERFLNTIDYSNLTRTQINKSCKCTPKCKTYIELESINKILCEKRATELSINLINKVKGVKLVNSRYAARGWTVKQMNVVIDWITKNGVNHGDYSLLAEMLGKTRQQVKNKVYYMEKQGLLQKGLRG